MDRRSGSWLSLLFPFHLLSPRVFSDPYLLRIWLREVILFWTRWGWLLLVLLLVLLFPTRSRLLGVALVAALIAGNAAIGWLLFQRRVQVRLDHLRLLANGLDWLAALVALVVFSVDLAAVAPAGGLVVQMMSTVRYRLRGIGLAFGGALALVVVWAGLHLFVFDAISSDRVADLSVGWVVILAALAMLQGLVIAGGQELRRLEQARIDAELASMRRNRYGLSTRELEILPYLARHDLRTQHDIGRALATQLSSRTVGTHIYRMSVKLEVPGGRWEVVRAARARGLLPPDDPLVLSVEAE